MSLGDAVVTRLEAVSGVTDLVGTGDSARIYPLKLPQEPTLEAITYQVIDDAPEHAMGSDAGVSHARLQVTNWGNDYDEAQALAAEVHTALSRFSGTSAGVVIQDILCMNKGTDGYEDVPGENRVDQDYMIHYEE